MTKFLSTRYFNTQTVITIDSRIQDRVMPVEFKLHELLLVGALTRSSVLLSGSSGSGKTYLAELVAGFLFGQDGYARKNITPDMNEQDFMDIDFGAIKEGKKLKEALLADDIFTRPGFIIDEANRAPPIIQNRLMQVLENNIDLKSKKIKAGLELPNNEHYHWIVLTLNFGAEYAGTSAVDRALKDRIVMDVPIDTFPPVIDDQIHITRDARGTSTADARSGKEADIIYDTFMNLDEIPLSLEAEALILYLSFCSNCIKSPTGSKYGVVFSPAHCKKEDCPHARNPPLNAICPFMFAPSNRALRNTVAVAKGLFLLRQAKILQHIIDGNDGTGDATPELETEVSCQDVIAVAPFILHSKIPMNKEWVANKFNGNTFLAAKQALAVINEQLGTFMRDILPGLVREMRNEPVSEKDKVLRKKLVEGNFHFAGLINYVQKYLC